MSCSLFIKFSTLKKETVLSFETYVNLYRTTRRHIREHSNIFNYRSEDHKYNKLILTSSVESMYLISFV
jgi:hypothetical protein